MILYDLFYFTLPALTVFFLLEFVQLGIYLKRTLTIETYHKMYPVWILILLAILLLNTAFIAEEFFANEILYIFFEIAAVL
ncbi:MAG: hypothetical protein ACC644_00910, partial [Candidatus Hydrothermarchaeales archaeon]